MTPEAIAQKVAWLRELAGQRFEQLELSFTVFHLGITESTRHREGERVSFLLRLTRLLLCNPPFMC